MFLFKKDLFNYYAHLYASFVLVGCLYPKTDPPPINILHWDKPAPLIIYIIFSYLHLHAFKNKIGVAIYSLMFGISIELLQPLTGRYFEWGDILFNSLGVLFGHYMYSKKKLF